MSSQVLHSFHCPITVPLLSPFAIQTLLSPHGSTNLEKVNCSHFILANGCTLDKEKVLTVVEGGPMSSNNINRRDFLVTAAGVASTLVMDTQFTSANTGTPSPPDLDPDSPISKSWNVPVRDVAQVDLSKVLPDLALPGVKERHIIYSLLLMKLIQRFWNGNKRGPLGVYPQRVRQIESKTDKANRYRGDRGERVDNSDPNRISWDRYLGHNIACLAVDGNGEIIDFDFNHNDLFRSSSEHAEARLVRRLFSLTDIMDSWKTGTPISGRSRAFSLTDVTLYTSLESCAQCSGVMSLGRVKQVVFLQHDPGAYRIGNIMYNLAGPDPSDKTLALAPLPISADAIALPHFKKLDSGYTAFASARKQAKSQGDVNGAFFISPDGRPDYAPSITSFLCTDDAFAIFSQGGDDFDNIRLSDPEATSPTNPTSWTNQECLDHARRFYAYADVQGFRGSPHKF